MEYKSSNVYKVTLNDGTSFESDGNASSILEPNLDNEFDWLSFHIGKELSNINKTMGDVKSIEIKMDFDKEKES